jgi:hypothetical protein
MNATKSTSSRNATLWATAYHEAGHAVAAYMLKIALRRKEVSIVPDNERGSDGSTSHLQVVSKEIEYDRSGKNFLRAERLVKMSLAGEIAQRRYKPRSMRSHHGHSDRDHAADLLSYFATSQEELQVWLKLLTIRTENMFAPARVWRAVEKLAAALMVKRAISGKEATEIISSALRDASDEDRTIMPVLST